MARFEVDPDWPHSEHGIAVDENDNVWITGNNPYPGTGEDDSDDMLLKFTRTGEFLMQLGGRNTSKGNTDTESLHTATDLAVHDGEVFISDGYDNLRVIVFDAETGAYKRMWDAFGNEAVDDPPAADLERMAAGQPGDFREPHDLATDSQGNLYVAEVGVGARAQKLVYKGLM